MKQKVLIKTIASIIVISSVIIIAGVFAQQILFQDSEKIVQSVKKAEEGIKKKNWEQAESQIDHIIKQWEGTKGIWSALLDHQEIDNIDVSIFRLQALVRSKDNASALQEAAALKEFVGHIPNKEKLLLDNVF